MIALSGLEAKDIAPYIASLLLIPTEGRYPSLEMAPSELKELTIAALIALFTGLAKNSPVLALLEDAHWIDPTSLDVFGRLIDSSQGVRALLVVTFRPEFPAPWLGRAHVTTYVLDRFGPRQTVAMIDRVASGKKLPVEVLQQIAAKTDGVPLFIEELTKSVLESGLLREEGSSYVLVAALTPLAIPSTLQDSLTARLDRLAQVKEIAQVAAAIGREFSYRLLEAVSPIKGPALQDALRQLMVSELIHGRGAPPEASYVFKHALMQDAAYGSLLRSRRQRIHIDIARALIEGFADRNDIAPAIIAHHCTEAGLNASAARNWLAAAELALTRSANAEASRHIDAGLKLIPLLGNEPNRRSLELSLHLARANTRLFLMGYTAPETMAALTEAKHILDAGVGNDLQRFSVLYGLCAASYFAGLMEPALTLARQIVEVANRQDDSIYRLVGYRLLGTVQVLTGQQREALKSLQWAEQYRNRVREKLLSYRFAIDPGLAVQCYRAFALWFLGFPDEAARIREQVRVDLSSHNHANTVATCNFIGVSLPELMSGDTEACEIHSAELVTYAAEKKVEQFRLVAFVLHTCARATREPTEDNIAALRAAMREHHRSGARITDTLFMCFLAQILLEAGDAKAAKEALQEAFVIVQQSGERFWLAELHRIDGRIAATDLVPKRAEACFLQAVEVARQQEARLLELRAATDLGQLWRDAGSPNDPRAMLEPILAAIEGGESTRDVRNARALLAEFA